MPVLFSYPLNVGLAEGNGLLKAGHHGWGSVRLMNELLTVEEATAKLKIAPKTLRDWGCAPASCRA
jgi:hypothetical protein